MELRHKPNKRREGMKRILLIFALILMLTMACFAFTACGDDTEGNPGDNSAEPEKDEISFKTFEVNGTDVYGRVSKDKEIFEFTNEIKVSGNAKYVVALDELGMQTVATKAVALNTGDNTFYVIEMVDDEPTEVYTVVIHRNEVYEVSFDTAGNGAIETQYIEEAGFALEPTMNIVPPLGYEFLGWDFDFTKPITGDVVVKAKIKLKDEMKNFEFTSTTTTCEITGLKDKTVTEIAIPDYVTSIGKSAFSACTGLAIVTIGNSVTSIGWSAFEGCTGLTSVTIPDSITSIGYYAFRGCTGLTSVTIPDSVTTIDSHAFEYCSSLTSVTIPDSVTSIGDWAFYNCTSLTSVFITDIAAWCGIYFNGTYANPLYYANNLYLNGTLVAELVIPDRVTSIGDDAFSGCTSLTSVTIPNSVTSIGREAFYYCTSLTSITVSEGNTAYKAIDGNLYSKDGKILIQYAIGKTDTSFTIPVGVTSIGSSAFYNCTSLTNVTIPDSITSIGDWAFRGCTSLTSVTIPDSVTSIGGWAFYGCTNITSVTIPDIVTGIGNGAFKNCSALKSLVIGNGVTTLPEGLLSGCSSLESLTIPFVGVSKSATSASSSTLFGYIFGESSYTGGVATKQHFGSASSYSYTTYYIPSSLKSVTVTGGNIHYGSFYNCSNLTSVTIGNSVTSIGEVAFCFCSSLTSVTIPDSVTSIGNWAFSGCTGLTSVTIPDSVTSIGNYAFYECTGLTIYCEAASEPSGWSSSWNKSNRPVVWGYKG